QMLELWRTHEAVNRYMLNNIPEAGMAAVPLLKNGQPGKGRTVARVFWHLYEVRTSPLRAAEKQVHLAGLPVLDKSVSPTRPQIDALLAGSSAAVEARLAAAIEAGEPIHK